MYEKIDEIIGVFSSKERAELIISKYHKIEQSCLYIEEFEVDE